MCAWVAASTIVGMTNRHWAIRFVGAGVWVLAALTWGSIAHHLLGLPDFGPWLAVVAVALVLVLPVPNAAGTRRPKASSASLEEARLSRP